MVKLQEIRSNFRIFKKYKTVSGFFPFFSVFVFYVFVFEPWAPKTQNKKTPQLWPCLWSSYSV